MIAHTGLAVRDFKAAKSFYERALALRPDDAAARIALGRCRLELGEREAGEAALRAAVQAAPQLAGAAANALTGAAHGRLFLAPSALQRFLRG